MMADRRFHSVFVRELREGAWQPMHSGVASIQWRGAGFSVLDDLENVIYDTKITRTSNIVLNISEKWIEYDEGGPLVIGCHLSTENDARDFHGMLKETAERNRASGASTPQLPSSPPPPTPSQFASVRSEPTAPPLPPTSTFSSSYASSADLAPNGANYNGNNTNNNNNNTNNNNNNNTNNNAAQLSLTLQQQQLAYEQQKQEMIAEQIKQQQQALLLEQARLADDRRRAQAALDEEWRRVQNVQMDRAGFATAPPAAAAGGGGGFGYGSGGGGGGYGSGGGAPGVPSAPTAVGRLTNGSQNGSLVVAAASSSSHHHQRHHTIGGGGGGGALIAREPSARMPIVPLSNGLDPNWVGNSLAQLQMMPSASIVASCPVAPIGMMRGMTGSDSLRRVAILDHQKRSDGVLSSSYIAYSVCLLDRPGVCAVDRRFSDFELLHEILFEHSSGLVFLPPLPPKKTFGNMEEEFLQHRHRTLERFLNRLLSSHCLREHEAVKLFLESTDDRFPKVWQLNKAKHEHWKDKHHERIVEWLRDWKQPDLSVAEFEAKIQAALNELKLQKEALKSLIKAAERTLVRLRGDAESVLLLGRSIGMFETVEKNRLAALFGIVDTNERADLSSPSLTTYERMKQSMGLVASSYEREANVENIMLKEGLEQELEYQTAFVKMLKNRTKHREAYEDLQKQETKAGTTVVDKKGETTATLKAKYNNYVSACLLELDRFRMDLATTIGMLFRDYAGIQVRHLVQLGTIWQRHFDLEADVMAPMPRPQRL